MAAHPKKRKTNDVLCIKMFGSFSISQIPAKAMRDITTASGNASTAEIALARIDTFTSVESVAEITASLSGRAHRLWLLVAYLIVNRDHGVSPQELIDLLWPTILHPLCRTMFHVHARSSAKPILMTRAI